MVCSAEFVFASGLKPPKGWHSREDNWFLKNWSQPNDLLLPGNWSLEIKDYEKVVVEELVKEASCDYEVVAGNIEFYYESEMVFGVHFGDGSCDGLATISWLKDGNLENKEVDVWQVFKKDDKDEAALGEDYDEWDKEDYKCFEFVLPITFTMPDGSTLTIGTEADWDIMKDWYETNASEEVITQDV